MFEVLTITRPKSELKAPRTRTSSQWGPIFEEIPKIDLSDPDTGTALKSLRVQFEDSDSAKKFRQNLSSRSTGFKKDGFTTTSTLVEDDNGVFVDIARWSYSEDEDIEN